MFTWHACGTADEREALIKLIDTLFGLKNESTSIEDVLAVHTGQLEQFLADLSVTRGRHLIPGQEAHIVPTKTQRQDAGECCQSTLFQRAILLGRLSCFRQNDVDTLSWHGRRKRISTMLTCHQIQVLRSSWVATRKPQRQNGTTTRTAF